MRNLFIGGQYLWDNVTRTTEKVKKVIIASSVVAMVMVRVITVKTVTAKVTDTDIVDTHITHHMDMGMAKVITMAKVTDMDTAKVVVVMVKVMSTQSTVITMANTGTVTVGTHTHITHHMDTAKVTDMAKVISVVVARIRAQTLASIIKNNLTALTIIVGAVLLVEQHCTTPAG